MFNLCCHLYSKMYEIIVRISVINRALEKPWERQFLHSACALDCKNAFWTQGKEPLILFYRPFTGLWKGEGHKYLVLRSQGDLDLIAYLERPQRYRFARPGSSVRVPGDSCITLIDLLTEYITALIGKKRLLESNRRASPSRAGHLEALFA